MIRAMTQEIWDDNGMRFEMRFGSCCGVAVRGNSLLTLHFTNTTFSGYFLRILLIFPPRVMAPATTHPHIQGTVHFSGEILVDSVILARSLLCAVGLLEKHLLAPLYIVDMPNCFGTRQD